MMRDDLHCDELERFHTLESVFVIHICAIWDANASWGNAGHSPHLTKLSCFQQRVESGEILLITSSLTPHNFYNLEIKFQLYAKLSQIATYSFPDSFWLFTDGYLCLFILVDFGIFRILFKRKRKLSTRVIRKSQK